MNCKKQQREVHNGKPCLRCIHRDCEKFQQIVNIKDCENCLLRIWKKQPVKKLDTIKELYQPEKCPYRYKHKDGTERCSITELPITEDICSRCDKETREEEAKLGTKVKNYFGAIRNWVAQGRPSRSKEEIERLFNKHCKHCDRYDSEKHACKTCGCRINNNPTPLANKLAMATAHCPLGRF